MADVKMSSIYKSFGNTEVIHGVDLGINDHEFVVFVGPLALANSLKHYKNIDFVKFG